MPSHVCRSTIRPLIKQVTAALERDWAGPNITSAWIIAYVRPFELETTDRNAKKVFDKIKDDFRSAGRGLGLAWLPVSLPFLIVTWLYLFDRSVHVSIRKLLFNNLRSGVLGCRPMFVHRTACRASLAVTSHTR